MPSEKERQWHRIRSISAAASMAPEMPGVYAYGMITRHVLGLPVGLRSWTYIGKSNNLAARFRSHKAARESRPELRDWIARNRKKAEVWYSVAEADEIGDLEKDLIRKLKPHLNKVKYQGGSSGDK